MLLQIKTFDELDKRRLMDVYAESNYENTDHFFPDETDKAEAVRKVEAGFSEFLKKEFFAAPESEYWILEENGAWVSALRTSRIKDGLYYLEALETRPDSRGKGYAVRLLNAVTDKLQGTGPFSLCSCVSKKNAPSIAAHRKAGFRIVSGEGYDYLRNEADAWDYGFEYRYPEE